MAPPPPELIDDTIAEILLRLPPDDPACLVRASVVCKLWRRILSDPTFPDRYRDFHRTPPLLGFLLGFHHSKRRFVPITRRTPFLEPALECRALDCRHGRVLFDWVEDTRGSRSLAVWDPITGDGKLLIDPDPDDSYCRSGAVLCAATGCNHRACHGGPFLVVFASNATARVYSSEAAAWSAPAYVQPHHDGRRSSLVGRRRAAIVGDQIYFLLNSGAEILKYDLGKQCLTMIDSPGSMYIRPVLLTLEDSSSLGFIGVKYSTLHLWRATKMNPDGSMGWVQDKVIWLENVLPIIRTNNQYTYAQVNVVGSAEGVDIILLGSGASGFIFDLKTERIIRKLNNPLIHNYYDVFPYMTFYIPDFDSSKLPVNNADDSITRT